jgi:hypothetical protein
VNLDGGRTGGVNLNGGCAMEAHLEEERGARREPRWRAHGWRGPRRRVQVEAHMEEDRGAGVEAVDAASWWTRRKSGTSACVAEK